MNMKLWIVPLAALSLGAWGGTTRSVHGSFDGGETFTGTSTSSGDGGNLDLTSNKGLRCTGSFTFVSHRDGAGTLRCSDNTSGSFQFVSTGALGTGTGTGRLGGRPFTFTCR